MGYFGLLESRTEGMSVTELVERPLHWNAPLFEEPRPFSERRVPPPALNDREHGKNHLSAENRSLRRANHRWQADPRVIDVSAEKSRPSVSVSRFSVSRCARISST